MSSNSDNVFPGPMPTSVVRVERSSICHVLAPLRKKLRNHYQVASPVVLQIAFFLTGHGRFCRQANGSGDRKIHTFGSAERSRKRGPAADAIPPQLPRPRPIPASSDDAAGGDPRAEARQHRKEGKTAPPFQRKGAEGLQGPQNARGREHFESSESYS